MIRRLPLVDDDPALRDILSMALAEEGFTIEVAATGPEGLRRFAAGAPDLVILDVLLPEMDGLELRAATLAEPAPVTLTLPARPARPSRSARSRPR